MPPRLEVLLQRRKSACAALLHRHVTASASAGIKPAVAGAENTLGGECLRIIQRSYINSGAISREHAEPVNRSARNFRQRVAEIPLLGSMFALRYGEICDNFH